MKINIMPFFLALMLLLFGLTFGPGQATAEETIGDPIVETDPETDDETTEAEPLNETQLTIADSLAGAAGVESSAVQDMRASGMGWGEIAQELGVHPSTIGLGVANQNTARSLEGPAARGGRSSDGNHPGNVNSMGKGAGGLGMGGNAAGAAGNAGAAGAGNSGGKGGGRK
jgi:hypothetical protein